MCSVCIMSSTTSKHHIQEDKADEVKALIARYILLKIEQKKIESKLAEVARYYDNDSLRTLFEPIGESMMGIVGLDLPRKKDMSADNTATTATANSGSSSTSTI
jgi:hypothetical protein